MTGTVIAAVDVGSLANIGWCCEPVGAGGRDLDELRALRTGHGRERRTPREDLSDAPAAHHARMGAVAVARRNPEGCAELIILIFKLLLWLLLAYVLIRSTLKSES